ncbi:transcription factor RFX4-like [Lytechinus variegatus]|uniref:transcription factor RFX4-like n=1 Tax=Lytechinus variegatus TaxID=7654 RepID=UPI001BB215F0|nr:transcription factor RFX4-like [Lytechinus variegatus]
MTTGVRVCEDSSESVCVCMTTGVRVCEDRKCDEFEKMLDDDVTLRHFTDWMDKVVETFVIKPTKSHPDKIINSTRKFLLTWSTFTSKVIRDLTIGSAPSFGSFHILHLMLEQYLLHKTDLIQLEARMNATLAMIREDCCQGRHPYVES